jgi:hypothetical protein
LLALSLKTGLANIAKNDSLSQTFSFPLVSTYGFSSASLKQAFVNNLLALPNAKSIVVYEKPAENSKVLGEAEGYCFTVDAYCADNTADGKCWYSLSYGGKTGYVNRDEILHTTTLREFVFGFSNGSWKIVAIR